MSNPFDPNEYLRLLLQLQQQQAGAAPQAQAPAPSLQPHNNPTNPANVGALASLHNVAPSSFTLPNALPAFHPTVPNPSAALGHAPANNAENDVVQQRQLLLASASMLLNVNPQLATAAMEHAMRLDTQYNNASQKPEHGVSCVSFTKCNKIMY
jgi:hypothetical protein